MKALIHIGMPKSGTSSIQAFLAMNKAALAAQSCLYAPFNPDFGSQYEFAVTALHHCGETVPPKLERNRLGFRTPQDQAEYVATYADFLPKRIGIKREEPALFIGSSEHIYAWLTSVERIEALDSWLQGHFDQVQYLVYLRPQTDSLTSGYSEAIRRGATHDFAAHLAQNRKINHWQRLQHWRNVVGPRLSVRLMQRDALAGGDLLQDFCAQLGVTLDGLALPARKNAALSRAEMALRRQLSKLLPPHGPDGRDNPAYQRLLRFLVPVLARDKTPLRLTPEQAEHVRRANAYSNEQIRKAYFPEREALF